MTFDLSQLRQDLHEYVASGFRGPMFDHPLHREISLASVANMPGFEGLPGGMEYLHDVVDRKVKDAAAAKANRDWRSYVFLHHRPYRIDALVEATKLEAPSRLWPLVGDVWINSESVSSSACDWDHVWDSAYSSKGKRFTSSLHVMRASERRVYDGQPILATANVCKADVLAYFDGRNESEIVVEPRGEAIYDADWTYLPSKEMAA